MNLEKFRELLPRARLRLMRQQRNLVTKENCVGFTANDWVTLTEYDHDCLGWWYSPDMKLPARLVARLYACEPEKIRLPLSEQFSSSDWVVLLRRNPKLADECNFEKLSADDWAELLSDRPEFVEKCRIGRFSGKERKSIVLAAPVLADKIDLDGFSPSEWCRVIKRYPEIAKYYNLNSLPREYRVKMLRDSIKIAPVFSRDDFTGSDWVDVLILRMDLKDRCDFGKLSGADWVSLIRFHPEFAERCPWDLLNGEDWSQLLQLEGSQKYEQYCDFSKLAAEDWNSLLPHKPGYWAKCPIPEELDVAATKAFMKYGHELAPILNLEQLSSSDWVELLSNNPDNISACEEVDGFSDFNARQYAYLIHCMKVKAGCDEIMADYYNEAAEIVEGYRREFCDPDDCRRTDEWKMFFPSGKRVTFDVEQYHLCGDIKPEYFRGCGTALAYLENGEADEQGYFTCYRLYFNPDAKDPLDAFDREDREAYYSPTAEDLIDYDEE